MKSTNPFHETCEAAALYALGEMSGGAARRFEQRLQSGCPLCEAELEHSQRAVEDLLLASDLVQPPPSLEGRLLERIGATKAPRPAKPALQPFVLRAEEGTWRESSPGVFIRLLHNEKTMIVRMEPGARIPHHDHPFEEQCLVLKGEIQDTEGNRAKAGDFIVMPKGSKHATIFTEAGAEFLVAYA